MQTLLIEAQYFPPIEYFIQILKHDRVELEAFENYQKQSFRNRCKIIAANGTEILTIPVIHPGQKVLIRDTKIDYSQRWLAIHWGAIKSAYGKAAYFEYLGEDFKTILEKKYEYLFDLNVELLTHCLKILRIKKEIVFSSDFEKVVSENKTDLRSSIHPKLPVIQPFVMEHVKYFQLFGRDFVTNCSILDLIFNEGVKGTEILRGAIAVGTNK